jgi:hypothetical protein
LDIAEGALDPEAGSSELSGSTRPDQERHITTGFEQTAPEISADRSGADDQDPHAMPSTHV